MGDAFWLELRQGHRLNVTSIGDWDTPEGVVVVSQSCDVVLPNRPLVTVAEIVRVEKNRLADALRGRQARLAKLPLLGDDFFASLDSVRSVTKSVLDGSAVDEAIDVNDFESRLDFARAIARQFGRFAFPDDFVPWVRPLEDVILSKHASDTSMEGLALKQVVEFRLEEASGWQSAPFGVKLQIILEPGQLPTFDASDSLSAGLEDWLRDSSGQVQRTASEIATALFSGGTVAKRNFDVLTAPDRLELWQGLGEAWALLCRPKKGSSDSVLSAVEGGLLDSEVFDADKYTFQMYRRSVQLDVDYLSQPAAD